MRVWWCCATPTRSRRSSPCGTLSPGPPRTGACTCRTPGTGPCPPRAPSPCTPAAWIRSTLPCPRSPGARSAACGSSTWTPGGLLAGWTRPSGGGGSRTTASSLPPTCYWGRRCATRALSPTCTTPRPRTPARPNTALTGPTTSSMCGPAAPPRPCAASSDSPPVGASPCSPTTTFPPTAPGRRSCCTSS